MKYCFERSSGDMDKYFDCAYPFFERMSVETPKVEAGLEWAGQTYNKCVQKRKAEDCLAEFKENVEYFVNIL